MTSTPRRFASLLAAALAGAAIALAAPAVGQPEDDEPEEEDTGDAGEPEGDADDEPDEEAAAAPPAEDADAVDVDALRQEYLALRDKLFRSRARAATVSSALYSTRVRIDLHYTTGRHYTVTRSTILLDGASVYDDSDGTIAKDQAPRFEGWVAPGRHEITMRIEAVGNDDDRFRSVIDDTFTIQAPQGKDVLVSATAKDGGDIPYRWQRKEKGSYKLHLDVSVETQERQDDASKAKK